MKRLLLCFALLAGLSTWIYLVHFTGGQISERFANTDSTGRDRIAAGFARRESDYVTVFIEALANAVDPSEAQSFIDRLGPGDAGFAGTLFVEADPKLF